MQNAREVEAARAAQARAQAEEAAAIAQAVAQSMGRTQAGAGQADQIKAVREALRFELAQLEERRDDISSQLQNPMVNGANRAGLERRIQQIDSRIAVLEAQAGELDAALARASGTAVTVQPARPSRSANARGGEDDPFIIIGALFMLCVALPLSIAYARRIWRRSGDALAAIPGDIAARLSRIEQNVDTVALEVERIGESQRFITKAFSEQRGLTPGAAEPVAAEREKDYQRRGT